MVKKYDDCVLRILHTANLKCSFVAAVYLGSSFALIDRGSDVLEQRGQNVSVPALDRLPSQPTLKLRRITTQDGKESGYPGADRAVVRHVAAASPGTSAGTSMLSQRRSSQVMGAGPTVMLGQKTEADSRLQLWDRDRPATPRQPAAQPAGHEVKLEQPQRARTPIGGVERKGRGMHRSQMADHNADTLVLAGETSPVGSLETTL